MAGQGDNPYDQASESSVMRSGESAMADTSAQTYAGGYQSTFQNSYADSARQSQEMSTGPNATLGNLSIDNSMQSQSGGAQEGSQTPIGDAPPAGDKAGGAQLEGPSSSGPEQGQQGELPLTGGSFGGNDNGGSRAVGPMGGDNLAPQFTGDRTGSDNPNQPIDQSQAVPNLATNHEQFADRMAKLFESPEYQQHQVGDQQGREAKANMIQNTVNNYLSEAGIAPVSVEAVDLDQAGGDYNQQGRVRLDNSTLDAGGARLANVTGHEVTHHEQQTLMINTAKHNWENGQMSFQDHHNLSKTPKDFVQNAVDSRQGKPLSVEELSRGNDLSNKHFDHSGEFRDRNINSQIGEHSLRFIHDLEERPSAKEFAAHDQLSQLHEAQGTHPFVKDWMAHPAMSDIKKEMEFNPDGSLKQWDEAKESSMRKKLENALYDVRFDSLEKSSNTYEQYRNWLWEVEASKTGEMIGERLKTR